MVTRSDPRDGFSTEPFCREDGEQRQHDELREQERRLRLLGSERVQRGHLQERLDGGDEDVEVEAAGSAYDVDRAPGAPEATTVASEDRDRQDHQRDDADDVGRQQARSLPLSQAMAPSSVLRVGLDLPPELVDSIQRFGSSLRTPFFFG